MHSKPIQQRRILVVDGATLAKLLLGPKGLDALFVGDAEVWIADLAAIDAERDIGVGESGPDVGDWLIDRRERLNYQATSKGDHYRRVEENWRVADLPDGFRPEWTAGPDSARLLEVQFVVEQLRCDWLVVVTDDKDVRAWLRFAEPRIGVCGAEVFTRRAI